MSLLQVLYNSYEYAEKNKMVDKLDGSDVILPMYHEKKKSDGKNIISVKIDKKSNIIDANFLEKNEIIVFPITEDSVARSSGVAPHPLVDNGAYLFDKDSKKEEAYKKQLEEWIDYSEDDFLKIIYNFISKDDSFKLIVDKFYNHYVIGKGVKIEYKKEGEKKAKTFDFSKVFFTFVIEDYDGIKDISVSENKKLHEAYIKYVKYSNENDEEKEKIICNISGKEDYLCTKHRPLMGTARLISQITASDENYLGRFSNPDQTIEIGTDSSQKIHLMAKYLLSSKKTSVWLGSNSYLVNWFSDDIKNDSKLNLNSSVFKIIKTITPIGTDTSKDIGESFLKGKILFSDSSKYYVAIFDKVSNGRSAAKYFKEMDTSILKENLGKWQNKYYWFSYNKELDEEVVFTPSPYNILVSAYGIERDSTLKIASDKFLQSQLQIIISSIVEGKDISDNIEKALENNLKQRQRYDKTWNRMKNCAMAILRYKEDIDTNMLDRENKDRSYLYGRLLAIYERIEKSCFDKDDDIRVSNAEKLWTSYINNPVLISTRLRNMIMPYHNKLMINENKRGIYFKLKNEMREVINLIDENYNYKKQSSNIPLGPGFMFGYEAQMKDIFTKKSNREGNDD
ncbi:type I-C CRISPR-associated protein Cas8c/Csd1 [Anaerococcus sp. AGMB00486]|uniref:Type I-C CRISPR-associated protein Cas8c/Csd1 n=2 Tax=Anaerococcus TaxID=165779 RepID=A0ABX2NCH5_9FIRM|nr:MULTISPECIES: type I-C CRISPR-associated protein Cas8c/Csd1 [Anaerococcus]MDY3006048.1 type I-C CRISPR-associated protein Cas8c/Csd1 [Anaerococcus porci]MSS78453.1 type I-C CRISPR-associated protein Cas8c/Csd1 [Anaerococcus porci]NVF12426.1 type I-C CRISPR-associated protein Cas8c/Csd1 [Anaerococcus faecalis]